MPSHLPKTTSPTKVLTPSPKLLQAQFPSIYRIIPDSFLSSAKFLTILKASLICLISAYLSVVTLHQFRQLQYNREQIRKIMQERTNVKKEIIYWQKIIAEFRSYSHAYLKIASLEYKLGNTQIAKSYIDQALTINPNLENGKVLGERISRQH